MSEEHPKLKAEDLRVGAVYRAKRFQKGTFGGNNDRVVIHLSQIGGVTVAVQYDSDTVALGRQYPTVDVDKFLRWASHEIKEGEEG